MRLKSSLRSVPSWEKRIHDDGTVTDTIGGGLRLRVAVITELELRPPAAVIGDRCMVRGDALIGLDEALSDADTVGRQRTEGRAVQTFDEYSRERSRLGRACEEIELIWTQFVSERTDLEKIAVPNANRGPESAVVATLDDARKRLASTTIEVGVFGSVKRGKSTLLNALVGEEVTSIRVHPRDCRTGLDRARSSSLIGLVRRRRRGGNR